MPRFERKFAKSDGGSNTQEHPSSEALQQVTLETSNYADKVAEVTGGLFNLTSRSGANQSYGSAYEYLVYGMRQRNYRVDRAGVGAISSVPPKLRA